MYLRSSKRAGKIKFKTNSTLQLQGGIIQCSPIRTKCTRGSSHRGTRCTLTLQLSAACRCIAKPSPDLIKEDTFPKCIPQLFPRVIIRHFKVSEGEITGKTHQTMQRLTHQRDKSSIIRTEIAPKKTTMKDSSIKRRRRRTRTNLGLIETMDWRRALSGSLR